MSLTIIKVDTGLFFFFFTKIEEGDEIKKWADTETKLFYHFYTIGPGQEWTALVVEKSVMFVSRCDLWIRNALQMMKNMISTFKQQLLATTMGGKRN